MKILRNIIIFIVIIAIVGGVAYLFLFKKDAPVSTGLQTTSVVDMSATNGSVDNTKVLSQQFLASLAKIKNITLAINFFDSPVYKSLQDYTQSIVLQDQSLIGRANPFAPFDTDIDTQVGPDTTIVPVTPDVTSAVTPPTTPEIVPPVKKSVKKK